MQDEYSCKQEESNCSRYSKHSRQDLNTQTAKEDENMNQVLSETAKQNQNVEQTLSKIPDHLINISNISDQSIDKLLKSGKFRWDEEFKSQVYVQIMETNFEWIRAMLHYGNFKLEILVIFTQIDERIFDQVQLKKGSFGVVRFFQFDEKKYAAKGVSFQLNQQEIDTDIIYKEYFLAYIASILQVGPQIVPLFGYDLLISKKMAFFCMEECQSPKMELSFQLIKFQLCNNLKIMHSIKFIHNDIKPENVIYNNRLKKYVFIDFGLSSLIKEAPGKKTRTKFCGTISYCSDEMKKCYFLKKSRYIDLYQNDATCLQKTIKALQSTAQIFDFNEESYYQEEAIGEWSILEEVAQILRLKYFVHTDNVQGVLDNFWKVKSPRTLYEILSNPETPKTISENKVLRDRLDLIKTKFFYSGQQIDNVDAVLCKFFCQEQKMTSAEKIIPFSQIIASEPEFFDKYLLNPELTLKLFHFFDPFSNSLREIKQKQNLKKVIVQKIYKLKSIGFEGPLFFAQKVRFVLEWFYENLRNLKNLRCMLSLRLLFLSIQKWASVERIQDDIIEIIEEPLLKVLKIFEFTLSRYSWFKTFKMINPKWVEFIMQLPSNQFKQTAKKIILFLLSFKLRTEFLNDYLEQKQQIFNEINQLSISCLTLLEKSSIICIKYIYAHVYQISQSMSSQGLTIKIYSRSWKSQQVKLTLQQQEQYKLFLSLRSEYQSQRLQKEFEKLLKTKTRNHFLILKQRNEPIIEFICQTLFLFDYQKSHLYFFLEKLRDLFLNQQIDFISSVSPGTQFHQKKIQLDLQFEVEERITCANLYMELMQKNLNYAEKDQKIQPQSKFQLITELQYAFSQFIQKQGIETIIANSFCLKIDVTITRLKFKLQKGQSPDEIRSEVQGLVNLLDPFPNQIMDLISNLFTLFDNLQTYVRQPENHFIKDIQLQITQQYIARQSFKIFQRAKRMPGDYVRINNGKGRHSRSLGLILQLIDYYQTKNNQAKMIKLDEEVLFRVVQIFCSSLPDANLGQIYLQIRFNPKQYLSGFYAYFVSELFVRCRSLTNEADQVRQVIITTLCLKNMSFAYFCISKRRMLKLYKHIITLKSKRKAFILRRLEMWNSFERSRAKIFVKELSSKITKITKNVEVVLVKLEQKNHRLLKV